MFQFQRTDAVFGLKLLGKRIPMLLHQLTISSKTNGQQKLCHHFSGKQNEVVI